MAFGLLGERLTKLFEAFSTKTLLKTMFSPWKQIVTLTPEHSGIDDKLRAVLDNSVSRIIGFSVRLFVVLGTLMMAIFIAVFSVLELIIWPVLPALPIVFIVIGLLK